MKRIKTISFLLLGLAVLTGFWYWADMNDYFQSDYKDLTSQQERLFNWHEHDDDASFKERYQQHFTDSLFLFPRQKVAKIKCFKNIPMWGVFTGKELKQHYAQSFVSLCNDTTNFDWDETTWNLHESEYYFKLYNAEDKVIGKIYFCLEDCGMTASRPMSPSMKFGALSAKGRKEIVQLISDEKKWK